MPQPYSSIECLEPRIAPAAIVTLTEGDGDTVKIVTSKGTNAMLDAAIVRTALGGGKVQITTIDLSSNAIFEGTTLMVTATRGLQGGDGFTIIPRIDANSADGGTSLNLGAVFIDGDLKDIDAGTGAATSLVTSINVASTSGVGVWNLNCKVGSLIVKNDLRSVEIHASSMGLLKVGGSIIGDALFKTGYVKVDGKLGSVQIGGSLEGDTGKDSGQITAGEIGAVRIGGSLIGKAENSGHLE